MSGKKVNIQLQQSQEDVLSKIYFGEKPDITKIKYNEFTLSNVSFDNDFFSIERNFNYLNSYIDVQYEAKKELPSLIANNIVNTSNILAENRSLDIDTGDYYTAIFDFKYNFLIKKYEDNIINIDEKKLPSVYNLFKQQNQSAINSRNIINNDIFENMTFDNEFVEKQTFFNPHVNSSLDNIQNFVDFFKKTYQYKIFFPMYVDISWQNSPYESHFNDLFTKHDLYEKILRLCNENLKNDRSYFSFDAWIKNQSNLDSVKNSFEFRHKINSIVKDLNLELKDIRENKKTYSEILAYKITKYDILKGTNPTSLQEWYIPNTKESIMNFVDTQVKYDKNYKYKLSLIVLTMGVNYKIKKIDNEINKLSFSTSNFINIHLIDGPEYSGIIYDTPPIEPEVEFIPYANNDSTVKILINTAAGTKKDYLLVMSDGELPVRDKLFASQYISADIGEPKILFSNDEPNKSFEIYKLDMPPVDYKSFLLGKKFLIDTKGSSAASFEDTELSPNKKYYYMFRGIDYHGHFSNPTKVYTLEIINNSGVIYHLFGIYDFNFDPTFTREATKKFNRNVFFQPAITHLAFGDQNQGLNRQIALARTKIGAADPAVWGKKFKIRITSISTGKKIDFNVKFDVSKG